ncbi:hypothetical protein NUU61_008152 [Penicillium alfredii]|uniref:ubiquitinyl hydrolase 1 n=1 Tax=Penicillium alfredii TaxID=1506179 RepID=A0A9W9ES18_9EURO|nr:uncharacterized protein NUU61_008152 [Penicillium alfredii]KAJ5086845.1 hypothetical protein NUU61_008152 [Penicillium alfredii]
MALPQKAGKTTPRLVEDVYLYDPAQVPGTGRNLLSQVPPVYSEHHNGSFDFISPAACRHNYVTKANQTNIAPEALRKRPGASSKVSAMCSKCRCHLQVVVNYPSRPNPSSHIHHLVYKSGRQKGGASTVEMTGKGQVAETFHYRCSHLSCAAMVSLRVLSPVLSPQFVHLLTDPDSLRKRADEAFATHPERLEGMAPPLPINVMDNLRMYISNALHDSQPGRSIPSTNKRFMVSFGVEGAPCKELLEFLDFTYFENEGVWRPPQVNSTTEKPYQDTSIIFLDDVVHELLALIHSQPASEKRVSRVAPLPSLALNDILFALDASEYPKSPRAQEFEMPSAPLVHPSPPSASFHSNVRLPWKRFYEDLGVVENMSSATIVEAYNQQVSVDPARAPFYLKCLKSIGTLRGGQDWDIIDQAVQVAYSEGKYTDDDVVEAYKYFGLWHDDPNLTDDSIIGKFYAFLSSTNQETEARQQLWRIGHSRRSERIIFASEERVSTVEQAQVFLGVDDQTPDDFITTMYTAKINDSPSSKDLATRAVKLIADARNSVGLNHFINTGETVASEMDIGDAYRLLQIPDRTADEEAIMAAYTICVDDNPEKTEDYNRALNIIAKEMNSPMLRNMAGITTEPEQNLADWPVGLQNIGNTCYLNSLLQFYFSVQPFRSMVLDYENFQLDLDDQETLEKKQVGSRKVVKKEVERSQRFLGELRVLFQDMITSPQSAVTPGQELARLTLISPENETAIRRRSTISAGRSQSLGDIGGAPILGPLGPPQPILEDQPTQSLAADIGDSGPGKDPMASDVDSEATLVSEGNRNDNSAPTESKENIPPPEDAAESESKPDPKINTNDSIPPRPELPSRPPPVPPRPSTKIDRQKQLIEEVEIGAQQDVTEVINNVLFQSQCAIKPRGFSQDGEQLDQIKDLFYGRTRSYISTEGGTRSKEEWWCDIKVDVASGSRDIYSAIDGAFDVQRISVGNSTAEQYGSISQLPPVLQVQVQRVQFDAVKKSSFKSTDHLELLETIYMDRYMDTSKPEIVDRRRQCWEWKKSLKSLEDRRLELLRKDDNDGVDMSTLFRTTQDALQDLADIEGGPGYDAMDFDSQLFEDLDQLSEIATSELHSVEQEIKNTQTMISSQFADYRNLPYRLYAVFVHHGSVSFGHYYIYIYDFRKDLWRKYNDEYVTEVQNVDEIFKEDGTRNPPTPYFLVYVHDQLKDRLANPVCRDIIDPMSGFQVTETPIAMQGVHAMKPSEDMDVDPPPYHEASGAPDSTVDSALANPLKRKSEDAGRPVLEN